MADNLKLPPGAAPPPVAGSKVQPKKETVRISLPPKPTAKETVRLELPPRTAAAAAAAPAPAPAAPKPAAPAMPPAAAPKPAAPAAPAAKQTVRLSLPPKPSSAKETVRLELPPKPVAKAPTSAGGHEIKLLVPQTDESAASATIPDATDDGELPTSDSVQAAPMPAASKPTGLKGAPPGSKLPGGVAASPAKAVAPPASAQPDSTPSAQAVPGKKPLVPKPEMVSAPIAVSGAVVRKAGWPDYTLAIVALLTGIAAVVRLLMILGGD